MDRMRLTAVLLLATTLSLGVVACKKGKDAETAADAKPTRPPSPSGTMSLQGHYAHIGTVGTFEDCTTEQKWRVSHEGDYVALEEAYLESAVALGEPLMVTIEGGIDLRPSPGGSGEETMLIVARYVKSWPGESCPGYGHD
ncbi:MAG: hypothetical protein WBG86_23355 [Polyangiales bacterium]